MHLKGSFVFAALLSAQVHAADQTFYVAPGGNDAWSGRLSTTAAGRTDGPFLTLQRARDAARQVHNSAPNDPVTIHLRGGEYFLTVPLELGPEDSQTTWAAVRGETPIVSGGRLVEHWTAQRIDGREVWTSTLPDDTPAFRELWIDGQRRQRARLPKQGAFHVVGLQPGDEKKGDYDPVEGFLFKPGDLLAWPRLADGELVLCTKWTESHLPIGQIDQKTNTVHLPRPAHYRPDVNDPYWIENLPACLTDAGEWRLEDKTLQYLPMAGEKIENLKALTPFLPQLVRIKGEPAAGKFVNALRFSGLTFANTEWWFDHQPSGKPFVLPDATGFGQAAVGVSGIVEGRGAHACEFDDCTFEHAGNYGLELGAGCANNTVARCRFSDLGAGGIKLGSMRVPSSPGLDAFGNIVTDCTIADSGRLFLSAVGIWIGQSHDNQLLYNDIHGLWYTGISIGWTWGYGKANGGGNIVSHNEVHHIGSPVDGEAPLLSDMGAIYTLGAQPRSVISFNRFHDIAGRVYGGWGIYFDEGTSDIVAEKNVVYRTTHGGFHQHYGARNLVSNNIFAFGRDAQIQRTRPEDHLSFTFRNNIVCWNTGTVLSGNWSQLGVAFDHDVYWTDDPQSVRLANRTWGEWQAAGEDLNSIVAAPGFVDASRSDFHLRKDAALVTGGFVPFAMEDVGPRRLRGIATQPAPGRQ